MQIRVKCNEDDTIGDLKLLVAAQTGMYGGCPEFGSFSFRRRSLGQLVLMLSTSLASVIRYTLKTLFVLDVGTRPEKIRIQKWYTVYKDHITLADYEIHDGMGLELYYN